MQSLNFWQFFSYGQRGTCVERLAKEILIADINMSERKELRDVYLN